MKPHAAKVIISAGMVTPESQVKLRELAEQARRKNNAPPPSPPRSAAPPPSSSPVKAPRSPKITTS